MAKGKGKKKTARGHPVTPQVTQCQTLDEDEVTRCDKPAAPHMERCPEHQAQFRKLYVKYKEASKVVDSTKSGKELPSKDQINRYTDLDLIRKKIRWVREYLEAIRVEKTGREIHSRRFFLKVDDGHKIRMKLLERQMVEVVETLDALEIRLLHLRIADDPAYDWIRELQSKQQSLRDEEPITTSNILAASQGQRNDSTGLPHAPSNAKSGVEEDLDLIDTDLRARKMALLTAFEPDIVSKISGTTPSNPSIQRLNHIIFNVEQQFLRRLVFHDPILFSKALDKVSFKDFFLDENLSLEDIARLFIMMGQHRVGFGMIWMRDAVIEAIAMSSPSGTAANVGDPKNRFKILGNWIFNHRHTRKISDEAWWMLLKTLKPPADVENRFVRLCNGFEDLISFLTFVAFGDVPSPSWCLRQDCVPFRNHLSLCGVAIADTLSPPPLAGPFPTTQRPKKQGNMVWAEFQSRGYMFGAVKNEDDVFTTSFLNELRARPDLFQVITRSDTAPGREVDFFGSPTLESMWAARVRTFEGPSAAIGASSNNWEVTVKALDILYGDGPMKGYLKFFIDPKKPRMGWFFRLKNFDVKYLVIIDTTPGKPAGHLAKNVAWAAFRALKLVEGAYNPQEYLNVSDALVERRVRERFSWAPEEYGNRTVIPMDPRELENM